MKRLVTVVTLAILLAGLVLFGSSDSVIWLSKQMVEESASPSISLSEKTTELGTHVSQVMHARAPSMEFQPE